MIRRPLGRTGLTVPPLGYGAFKIGRNQGIKYATPYDLPDEAAVARLLDQILELGCDYLDTAPAYGLSEARLGRALGTRTSQVVISTKVGETFEDGVSTFDFSRPGVLASLDRSRERLRREVLDLVLIHSPGADLEVLEQTDVVAVLQEERTRGAIRGIGLSGKTIEGARAALGWADAIMVEYHQRDPSHAEVLTAAAARGVGVIVKKGLASGALSPEVGIPFALAHPAVTSLVVGGLNYDHFAANWELARASRP